MRRSFRAKCVAWMRAKEFWLRFFSESHFFFKYRTKTLLAGLSPSISGSLISVVTFGREAMEVSAGKPNFTGQVKRMAAARIRALVWLQRRKHNLIIMYGHISRMSPCLGQCTRRWYRIPTILARWGRVRGYSWRVRRTWGPLLNIDDSRAAIILAQSLRPCLIHTNYLN